MTLTIAVFQREFDGRLLLGVGLDFCGRQNAAVTMLFYTVHHGQQRVQRQQVRGVQARHGERVLNDVIMPTLRGDVINEWTTSLKHYTLWYDVIDE